MRQAGLVPASEVETYALIIRIGYCPDAEDREDALQELWSRGSWVGEGQPGRDHWVEFEKRMLDKAQKAG